jgi:isoleucyl-tRNA synthetase
MKRVPEVFDCWFESGSMPFAQDHYPFENPNWQKENFPSGFVAEYIAQTRTWFYYSTLNDLSCVNRYVSYFNFNTIIICCTQESIL